MTEEWIETLKDRVSGFLRRNHDAEVVDFIAFGSVASGEFRPGESDLDVIVVVDELDEPGDAFFMSEDVKHHVSVEDTPAVGVDAVVTPRDDVPEAKELFDDTKPI